MPSIAAPSAGTWLPSTDRRYRQGRSIGRH